MALNGDFSAIRPRPGDVAANPSASAYMASYAAAHIPEGERPRFIEAVETDLLGLHEGNFARYRVRESEFAAWRIAWERRAPHAPAGRSGRGRSKT